MKILEKISLALFSIIVLILSLITDLLIFGWIKVSTLTIAITTALSTPIIINISLILSIVLILLSIKCIFFTTKEKKDPKTEGILLENESGKLLISINTLENLVKGVLKDFSNIKSSTCKVILDKQINNVNVDLSLVVEANTVLKDLSAKVQDRIKEVVKQAAELEIKEVNIRIKDIQPVREEKESNE